VKQSAIQIWAAAIIPMHLAKTSIYQASQYGKGRNFDEARILEISELILPFSPTIQLNVPVSFFSLFFQIPSEQPCLGKMNQDSPTIRKGLVRLGPRLMSWTCRHSPTKV
jgi:hypothetical protein